MTDRRGFFGTLGAAIAALGSTPPPLLPHPLATPLKRIKRIGGRAIGLDKVELNETETKAFLAFEAKHRKARGIRIPNGEGLDNPHVAVFYAAMEGVVETLN